MNLNFIKKNYFTKELATSLEYAADIAPSSIINVKEVLVSLLLHSKLLQKILYVTTDHLILLNDLIQYKSRKTTNKKIFSKQISLLFYILSYSKIPFNSVSLFTYIYKFHYNDVYIILNYLGLDYNKIYIQLQEDIFTYNRPKISIPKPLQTILSNIHLQYNEIIGRDNEVKQVLEILKRLQNNNPLLVGENGIGKYSIIEKLIYNVSSKIFIKVDVVQFVKKFEEDSRILEELNSFVKKYNTIILICENIDLLFECSKNERSYLGSYFIKMLESNDLNIISTISGFNKYQELIKKYEQLPYLLSTVEIKPLSKEDIIQILVSRAKELSSQYNISITKDNIEILYDLNKIYIKHLITPIKDILILESVFSTVGHQTNTLLVKEITKQDILNAIKQYSTTSNINFDKNTNKTRKINTYEIEEELKKRVFGQNHAITNIASSIKRAFSGMKELNKPIGSWLLCGPSGTGKTEMVKALASSLFGSEADFIRFDMSEFKEPHDNSKLIGCPPGYVGYEQGGLLTNAVKKKPYTVILFDEIEKAHKNVNDLMLQLLDEGRLTDSFGEVFDFTNTIIIFTSNLGCPKTIEDIDSIPAKNGEQMTDIEFNRFKEKINKSITSHFKPEFLNRLTDIIVYKPLTKQSLLPIVTKYIQQIETKLSQHHIPLYLDITVDIKNLLIDLSYNPLYGARPLKRIIEEFIENTISEIISNHTFNTPYRLSIFSSVSEKTSTKQVHFVYTPIHKQPKKQVTIVK